jgi:hypothetical protein
MANSHDAHVHIGKMNLLNLEVDKLVEDTLSGRISEGLTKREAQEKRRRTTHRLIQLHRLIMEEV